MRNIFLCLIFLFFNLNLFAQNNTSSIKGKVIDENDAPLPYVSVAVYQDDKIITGTITNDDGVFTLKVQQSDKEIRLAFDFVGYIKEEIKKRDMQQLADYREQLAKNPRLTYLFVESTSLSHIMSYFLDMVWILIKFASY